MAPSALPTNTAALASEKPGMQQTPLEAISQGEVLPGIPAFPTFAAERAHILTHMAATFRQWARLGFAEGQSGHISVRDPEFPALMWLNPLSRHFGSLAAGDMICVEIATGRIVAGSVK